MKRTGALVQGLLWWFVVLLVLVGILLCPAAALLILPAVRGSLHTFLLSKFQWNVSANDLGYFATALGIVSGAFIGVVASQAWIIRKPASNGAGRLLLAVRAVDARYPVAGRAVRWVDGTLASRALVVQVMSEIGAVTEGHISFYCRHCAARVVDAAKLLHSATAYIDFPPTIPKEQWGELEKRVSLVASSIVSSIVRRFGDKQISKVVFYDNLVNRNLAYLVTAGLAEGKDREPEGIAVKRTERHVAGLEYVDEADLVEPQERRRAPIEEGDHVLILEANLGPKRRLEEVVCLVRRNMPRTAEVHVAVVFDGSESAISYPDFGVANRNVWAGIRVDLGLQRFELCHECEKSIADTELREFSFEDNYMP